MSGFWSNKKVMVTGGSGFLGAVICRKLGERGVLGISIPRSRDFDLTRADDVEKLFTETSPDVVIHLAARVGGIGANMKNPADLYLTNLLMGTYVIEEARRREAEKTVIVGTICAYPKHTPVPFREEDLWEGYPEETNAPYGIAKKALLVHAQANRAQYGQNAIYLLPTNLYGPGDKFNASVSHVIPALIKKFVEGSEQKVPQVEVWGTGSATREFLYVEDAAEGILLGAESYDGAEPVNLGSGREVPIVELATTICRLTRYEGDIVWDTSRPDGQPRRAVDTSKAKDLFGFETETDLEDGLRRTIEWYVDNREIAEAATF